MASKFLSIDICSWALGPGHEEVWEKAMNGVERPTNEKFSLLLGIKIRVLALQKYLVKLAR